MGRGKPLPILTQHHKTMRHNTIYLLVRVDYSHKGKEPQHQETAAGMVINSKYPTIEQGVRINHVEAYSNGVQVMSY